ncbi:formylglycine-generating enzyme required for sulfatase activity [Novosphingobium hassiacum]|uniref:Formylglycine-generating enzyme required for sulfatase activity n=1 Tax=Novosphingobium hassiacum TaxID=173676 RepID=A0A7W6EVV3_9SPHN|nr:formylglycine-generating enzyme required for sulfatase activity [Novosphingobium hassiacum]
MSTTGFVNSTGTGPVQAYRDLDLVQMREKIAEFRQALRNAGPDAFGVLYFSGHGAALTSYGDLVLLPVDAPSQLSRDHVSLTRARLTRDLLSSGAKNILIVLDMCRNVLDAPPEIARDPVMVSEAAKSSSGVVGSKGLRRIVRESDTALRPDQGYLVAFSTSADQVAFDNGAFSRILAEEVRRPLQNIADALKRTSDRVAVAGLKSGKTLQKPTFDYGLQGAPPCFVSCDANAQDRFYDCANCPYLKVVPAGSATIGSTASEPGRGADEPIQRQMQIERPFAVSVFEVTISEWAACVRDRACRAVADWSKENPNPLLPATGIGFDDAQAYVAWLSVQSGLPYRVPTELEWEYAARANSHSVFPWGDEIAPSDANYDQTASYRGSATSPYRGYPEAVTAYPPNAFGLYQMVGNAWEWTTGCSDAACKARIVRGGSFQSTPAELRTANRLAIGGGRKRDDSGLRVVRDLNADEVGQ